MKQNKLAKLELGSLQNIVIGLVTAGLIAAFGLQVVGDVKSDTWETDCTTGYWNSETEVCQFNSTVTTPVDQTAAVNASSSTLTAVTNVPNKLGTIAVVLLAGIIIFFLVRGLRV